MAEEIPKTSKQWRVTGYDGFDALKFMEEEVPILSDNYVLVKSKPSFPLEIIQGHAINRSQSKAHH